MDIKSDELLKRFTTGTSKASKFFGKTPFSLTFGNPGRFEVDNSRIYDFFMEYIALADDDLHCDKNAGMKIAEVVEGDSMPLIVNLNLLFDVTDRKLRTRDDRSDSEDSEEIVGYEEPKKKVSTRSSTSEDDEEKSQDDDDDEEEEKEVKSQTSSNKRKELEEECLAIKYFTDKLYVNFIKIIQDIIIDKLHTSEKFCETFCCVLQSKPYIERNKVCIKLRFHFPYCNVNISFQKHYLFPLIKQELRHHKALSYFLYEPNGTWDTIIEDIRSVFPLYRSKNDFYEGVVTYVKSYGKIPDNFNVQTDYTSPLKDIFDIRFHSYHRKKYITSTLCNKDILRNLPLFLSINYWDPIAHPKKEEVMTDRESGKDESEHNFENYDDDKESVYLCKIFLPMLSKNRFMQDNHWLMIGNILFNIFTEQGNDDEGLELWCKYSLMTDKKRMREQCERKYLAFRENHYSVKTLAWYAREDSPEVYKAWHDKWCHDALKDSLTLIENDIMEAVYRIFWLDFINTGEKIHKAWNYYDKTRYKPVKNAIKLRQEINNKVIPCFKRIRQEACNADTTARGKKADDNEQLVNKLSAMIKKLGNNNMVKSVVNMCELRFYDENFEKYKDKNYKLMGLTNGVIECGDREAIFRPGIPEDYITMSTGVRFDTKLSWGHPSVVFLMDWFKKVFCDYNEKTGEVTYERMEHFLKHESAHLLGKNNEKLMSFWLGPPNAGKSLVMKLKQAAFGDYCCDGPNHLVTKLKTFASSGPTPELAQLKGAHTIVFSEIGESDDLDGGKVKKLCGGDRFYARFLQDNGGSIDNYVKAVAVLNAIPEVSDLDEAVKDRFCIHLFHSCFSRNAPDDEEEQFRQRIFKRDDFFDQRIPELASVYLWVLTEYYKDYKKYGLKPPESIVEFTSRYWNDVDNYNMFKDQKLDYQFTDEGEIDQSIGITADDIYPHFVKWFKLHNPGKDIPICKKFKTEMSKIERLGPPSNRGRWYGVNVKTKEKPQNVMAQ
jgi:phage/plasmid-associated DNA primase